MDMNVTHQGCLQTFEWLRALRLTAGIVAILLSLFMLADPLAHPSALEVCSDCYFPIAPGVM